MRDYLSYIYLRAPLERKLLLALPFLAAGIGAFFDPWTALQRALIGVAMLLAYGLGVHDEILRVREDA